MWEMQNTATNIASEEGKMGLFINGSAFTSVGCPQRFARGYNDGAAKINKQCAKPPQDAKPPPAPGVTTEMQTVVVDALCRGGYATITDALKAVKAGARILVRPGVYKEGIVLDKPVEIIGDGNRDEIVIKAHDTHAVLFQADSGRIANLTLRQSGGIDWYGVDIAKGRLELEDCDISSKSFACVAIHGGANLTLSRCRIHDGKAGGVFVYEKGQGTLEDSEICANAKAGVEISDGGSLTLRRCRIHDGKATGVVVWGNSQGTLEDNEIVANAYAGVSISEGVNAALRRNTISRNGWEGVWIHDKGGGFFEDNDLRGNAEGAWNIAPNSKALAQRKGNKE